MKKLLSMVMVLSFVLTLIPATVFAADEANPEVRTLQAGNDPSWDIGEVRYWNDNTNLYVEFYVDDRDGGDWQLLKTNVLATDDDKLKGSLATGAPGQFPYEHFPPADPKFDSFTIPLADLGVAAGDDLIVAFHANVQDLDNIVGYVDNDGVVHPEPGNDILGYTDINGVVHPEPGFDIVCPTLDPVVSVNVAYPGGDSYFNTTVSNGGALDGTYDGFCVDTQTNISPGTTYNTVNAYYSTDVPAGVVDRPENLDLVNWIINQDFTTQFSPAAGRNYTFGDIQRAIWMLVDDNLSTAGLGTWSQAAADEIYAAAAAIGPVDDPTVSWEPGLDDEIAVILQPVNSSGTTNAQVTIAQVTMIGVGCEAVEWEPILEPWDPVFNSETAWAITEGDGISFPRGNNWGLYYIYLVTE